MTCEEPTRPIPAEIHVVSEIVLFGPTVMHHVVHVQADERDAMRLFGMNPRNRLGRHQDQQNMRLFSVSTKATFDADPFVDDVPRIEHASLTAFFKAIGYSFRRNRYARCERALAAFGGEVEAIAA